jgi:hypothetical protein
MKRTLVLDVVGLTPELVGEHTPALAALVKAGAMRPLTTVLPAVTCSVQSTFTTGLPPSGHGCVGNGWYFRELAEVAFWRQSNPTRQRRQDLGRGQAPRSELHVREAVLVVQHVLDRTSVTPRPMCPADGRKLPDIYTQPPELRDSPQAQLGQFPLFDSGARAPASPRASGSPRAPSTCGAATSRRSLVYLLHLDYDLQRQGPRAGHPGGAARDRRAVRRPHRHREADGAPRCSWSPEYGITAVDGAVHINRVLRDAKLLTVRTEQGRELLDPGASKAFAVADHQVAHVYVRDTPVAEVKALLERTPGIERVLDGEGKRAAGLDHARTGELVAISAADKWFTYYYWNDEDRAPDFARTVDIHRKPGYDPSSCSSIRRWSPEGDRRLEARACKLGFRRCSTSRSIRAVRARTAG